MKLIIFDIDGTLTDTKKVDDVCFIYAFEKVFGIDIVNMDWSEFTTVTDWGIVRDIVLKETNKNLSVADHEQMKSIFFAKLLVEKKKNPSLFKEIPGALDFYNLIKNKPHYQVGIATGCWKESGVIKLKAIGIDSSDVAYANSDDFITREEIVLHTIAQAEEMNKGKFSEIIYFGDGVWDFNTCKNIGIRFVGIDIKNDGILKELGTQTVFTDFLNVKAIVKELD